MKFFVKDASYLAKIKNTQLRKLLWMGARHKTPLRRKITADPFYRLINDKLVVTSVNLFAPGNDGEMPDWTIDLNQKSFIADSDWHLMFEPLANYERWYGIRMEEDYKRDLIDKLIEAASIYGQVKSNCANGFISDVEGAMRPAGKDVREIRKSLYEALGL